VRERARDATFDAAERSQLAAASTPRLAAIFAHPDDDAYTIGGTLAQYAGRIDARILLCTSGGNGPIWQPVATRESLADVREREHAAWCEVVGLPSRSAVFLRYIDGALADVPVEELVQRIEAFLSDAAPHVVVTFGRDGMTHHPDHIRAGAAATEAFRRAREGSNGSSRTFARLYYVALRRSAIDHLYREVRERRLPFGDEDAMYNPVGVPDDRIAVDVDVTNVYERKIDGIRMHRSQIGELERLPIDLQPLQLSHECFERAWPEWEAGSTAGSELFEGLDVGRRGRHAR
jgi:LmbE family N-acetylglucosaminyl deacetylase